MQITKSRNCRLVFDLPTIWAVSYHNKIELGMGQICERQHYKQINRILSRSGDVYQGANRGIRFNIFI